jgi:hypothetical protein
MPVRDDDRFRPKVAPPKSRGTARAPKFTSRVLKAASQIGPTNGGTLRRQPSRGGARFGRGHVAAKFAGQSLRGSSRRVVIKTRLVNLTKVGPRATIRHLRYIERDGVTKDGSKAHAYGSRTDAADIDSFERRGRGDRHQFRFIVSPEDAGDIGDLKTYTRDLMSRMEADLGTKLDWVAVDHWNTDNPHTHIVIEDVAALMRTREVIADIGLPTTIASVTDAARINSLEGCNRVYTAVMNLALAGEIDLDLSKPFSTATELRSRHQ